MEHYDQSKHGNIVENPQSGGRIFFVALVLTVLPLITIISYAMSGMTSIPPYIVLGLVALIGITFGVMYVRRKINNAKFRESNIASTKENGRVTIGTVLSVSQIRSGKSNSRTLGYEVRYTFVDADRKKRKASAFLDTETFTNATSGKGLSSVVMSWDIVRKEMVGFGVTILFHEKRSFILSSNLLIKPAE